MNIQGTKKPPTPVQAHAQQQIRGQHHLSFYPQGLPQNIAAFRPEAFEYSQQQVQQQQQVAPPPHLGPQPLLRPRQPHPHPPQYPSPPQHQQQAPQHQLSQQQQQQVYQQQLRHSQQQHLLQQQQQQQHRQQHPQQQQQIRPLLPPPQSLSSVAVPSAVAASYQGGLPHDMNQVSSVAPVNLPPQPPTPPHQQNHSQQPTQNTVMFQPRQSMIARQNVPPQQQAQQQQQQQQQQQASMGPQRQPGPPHTLGMSSSPGPSMYPGTTMFMQGQAPHFMPGQQVITLTGGPNPQVLQQYPQNMAQQQRLPQPQQYITSQPLQTQPYSLPYHAYSHAPAPPPMPAPPMQAPGVGKDIRQPTNTIYYNSQPGGPGSMSMGIPQVRQTTPTAAQPYQKKIRKGLAIVDPNTGVDISPLIYSGVGTPPNSETSSSRATPVSDTPSPSTTPNQQQQEASTSAIPSSAPIAVNTPRIITPPPQPIPQLDVAEIQSQFAQQVTAAIRGVPTENITTPKMPSSTPVTVKVVSKEPVAESPVVPEQEKRTESVAPASSGKVSEEREVSPAAATPPPPKEATPEPLKEVLPVAQPSKQEQRKEDEEEKEGQGRKKKGKHKIHKEGTDMDAYTDEPNQVPPPPAPTPAVAATPVPATTVAAAAAATENNVEPPAASKEPSPQPISQPPPTPVKEPSPVVEVVVQPPTPEAAKAPQNNNKETEAAAAKSRETTPTPKPAPPAPEAEKEAVAPTTTPAAPAPADPAPADPAPAAPAPAAPAPADPAPTPAPAPAPTPAPAVVENSSEVVSNNERNSADKHKEPTPATPEDVPAAVVQADTTAPELVNNKETKEQNNREEREQNNADQAPSSQTTTTPVIDKMKELRYVYKEDQWSPLNPEGKKLYDRSFLLTLQFSSESTSKPEGLTHLPDIILDSPIRRDEGVNNRRQEPSSIGGPGRMDFTPGYIKSMGKPPPGGGPGNDQRGGGGGGGAAGGKRNSQQKHRDGPRKIISIPLQMDVKLHQSDSAWKLSTPKDKKDKEAVPEEDKSEALYKAVIGILNKLTPQKFQTLIKQILDLEIDTEERLKGSIDRIFEKAIDEPNFSVAYANMCKCMTVLKVPSASNPQEQVLFRNLLLNRCQKEFERDRASEKDMERREKEIEEATSEEDKKRLKAEMAVKQYNDKRRSLGNIRFIGELFKLKMLTEKIMHDCLVRLLKSNDEENLECLCRLMSTIGKDIDHPKNKQRVEAYFSQLDKIIKLKATSSRVRFMIQDLIDLRASKWTPRRDDNNPKTIEQIHREAQQEDQQRQVLVARLQQEQKHLPQGGRGGGPRGRNRDQQQQQQQHTAPVGEDGWHSVGGGKSNRIDPDKMKLTRHTVDDNIQLGPGGRPGAFGTWGRGSSGGGGRGGGGGSGSRNASQEMDRASSGGNSNAPTNRFSALSASSENYDARSRGAGRGLPPGRADSRDGKSRLGGRGGGRGASARSSMEQEREAALAAARNITGGGGGRGSRNQSRESSKGRDGSLDGQAVGRQQAAAAAPLGKQLSPEELERKSKSTLDEYLQIHDLKEAMACVKELSNMHMFVYHALNHVLEKTKQGRQMTGHLLHDLVKNEVLTQEQYLQGLHEILEFAEDMEIDIPKVWTYLGEMIGPMVQDGSVPLNFLRGACKPLTPKKAGQLLAEILHDASQRLGHLKVGEQWRQSGLTWDEFLDPNQDLNEFISRNKLEFTIGEAEPSSPVGKGLSREEIKQELDNLIVKKQVENSDVIDWVMANVGEANTKEPAFIRALMTSVCSSVITSSGNHVDIEMLKKRVDLLQRYLDHNDQLELHALYAVQALVHKLEHPAGVLRSFFDTLYDEDIISEDAFNQWDNSTDPAEMAGKGVARSGVEQFFTWLQNADEEQADN